MQDLKNLNCLLPKTEQLLLKMVDTCPFLEKYVLVGGSALAMHLCHRKSEDLDFFTYDHSFDKKAIFGYLKTFEQKEILNQSDEQIDILIDGVKVTFFNAKWAFLKPIKPEKFNLATLQSISAMKVNVLFLRATYRDYYDIYFLLKETMGLKEMFGNAQMILEGITFKLFTTALLYIDDIEDDNIEYLQPKKLITKHEIQSFFLKKLNNLT